jgi:hypothetical protein
MHDVPHEPQFSGSMLRLKHSPLQSFVPAGQVEQTPL